MFHLRLTTAWIAAAVLCFGIGTAAGTDYVYDFDNGQVTGAVDPGITLIGQDNWNEFIDREDLKVRNDMGGDPGITGLAGYQDTLTSYSSRVNNGDFNYSIPAATEFRIEFNLLVGTGAADTFGLAVDLNGDEDVVRYEDEIAFRFGAGKIGTSSFKGWYIRQGWTDAGTGTEIGSTTEGPSDGETWRVVLDVDPTFDGGNGAGSMSVQLLSGLGGMLTPVSDLQDINLGLNGLTKPDPSDWDALFVSIGEGAAADDLTITVGGTGEPIPGDANLDDIVNDQDASILAAHWQQTGMSWGDGDFNNDQVVNDQDASILAAHWQETGEGVAPVPEPGMGILLIGGALALLVFRRRRKPAR